MTLTRLHTGVFASYLERTMNQARSEPRRTWQRSYVRSAVAVDLLAGANAGAVAMLVRFGFGPHTHTQNVYTRLSATVPLVWILSLWIARAHEVRFLAIGAEEWRRVCHAAVGLTAVAGFVAFAARFDLARGYVVLAIPTAVCTTVAGRLLLRRRLSRARRNGRCLNRVLAVGHAEQVTDLVCQSRADNQHGMTFVGVCLPDTERSRYALDIPVLGGFGAVAEMVTETAADTVAVMSCPEIAGPALRRLAWDLERTHTDLVVAPGLLEVAGARLHARPVNGLSLLQVEHPTLSGGRRWLKSLFDRVAAAALLACLLPVLLVIACVVRLTSPGPAIFRQRRVGRDGADFTILKFRTMFVDAERRRQALAGLNDCDGILFKLRSDPRVTRVGAWLRRYSLDELPQLVNVLLGHMSLVGPRPPLPEEVAQYGGETRRRLCVLPGLTGLWQVSGRSNLSWEESVRLDLRYVENWSFTIDLVILWKTVAAVVRGHGAY